MAETTGTKLKKRLGLEKFRQVKITRALISTFKTYLVFYNSRRPNFPITQRNALVGYMPSQILIAPFEKRPTYTPLMDIEDFNGSLRPAFVFVVDMAGQFSKSKELDHFPESVEPLKLYPLYYGSLSEDFFVYGYPRLGSAAMPIFKNPSAKEIREFGRDIRGIFDGQTGDTYISDYMFLHENMIPYIQDAGGLQDVTRGVYFWTDLGVLFHSKSQPVIEVYSRDEAALGDFLNSEFYQKHIEGKYTYVPAGSLDERQLNEFLTMGDLQSTDTASSMTKRFRKARNTLVGKENTLAKLVDLFIDEGDKSVTFAFLTEVTPYPDDPDYEWQETDPTTFDLSTNRSKVYEIQIKILEFLDWLGTEPDKTEITEMDVKEVFKVSNAQVFSTSPSFHWQGMNYNLSQLDGSIHPTTIAPKVWNQPGRHGPDDYFLDKHLYGLMRNIVFWYSPMASMLTKKLKDRGLI